MHDRLCVALEEEDCRASRGCKERGNCFLDRVDCDCTDGTEHRSAGAMGVGIALAGLGVTGLVAGAAVATGSGSSSKGFGVAAFGGVAAVLGGVSLAVSMPLLIYGAPIVSAEERDGTASSSAPTVTVAPTGGSLTWRF
jgi:hypothetical protein